MASVYRFSSFLLDVERGELLRLERGTKEPIHVPPQPFRVLEHLLDKAGHLVTRGELGGVLWSDDVFVDQDLGLNHCIRRLRRVLGDTASCPRYIQTVPRRGYRFVAEVVEDGAVTEEVVGDGGAGADPSVGGRLRVAVLPFVCFSAALVENCFGEILIYEILREAVSVADSEQQVIAPLRPLHDDTGAGQPIPDLVLTGSAQYEAGLLRVLGYLFRADDGVVVRTWVWQIAAERIDLETHLQAAEALVANLLKALPSDGGARREDEASLARVASP